MDTRLGFLKAKSAWLQQQVAQGQPQAALWEHAQHQNAETAALKRLDLLIEAQQRQIAHLTGDRWATVSLSGRSSAMKAITGLIGREALVEKALQEVRKGRHVLLTGKGVGVGVTVHSPRPLAGEGLGVRAVISKTYPLTLTLSPMNGGEGTE